MMRTIFDAGPQRWKIWFVTLILVLCGAGLVAVGGSMLQSYGLAEEDGVLRPLASRILVGGFFALPGAAVIAAMVAYLRCYVTRVEVDDAGSGFRVTLAGAGRGLSIRLADVVRVGYNEGISHAGGISVNAPWYGLRLRGRRLPLIVDMQGNFLDQSAVDRLMRGEPSPV
jgi:hypothetical protein